MTDLDYNGYPILHKGDTIIMLAAAGDASAMDSQGRIRTRSIGSNGYGWFLPGERYTLTSVTTHTLRVRLPGGYGDEGTSVDLQRTNSPAVAAYGDLPQWHYYSAEPVDPNAPKPRKLGDTPAEKVTMADGTEEWALPISDPRIQWIWADLETYANGKNWCPEYDKLAAGVQIPGRMRSWKAERIVNGLTIRGNFKARSQAEADTMLETQLERTISGLLGTSTLEATE